MSVVEAIERDLEAIRQVAPEIADSALAATALVLARELDNAGNSATSKSMCARAMAEALERLRDLTPEREDVDLVDQLSARRAARRAGGAAA